MASKGRRFALRCASRKTRRPPTDERGRRQRQIAGDLGIERQRARPLGAQNCVEEDLLSGPHEDAAKELITRLRDLARQERDRALLDDRFRFIDFGEGRVGDADIPPVQTAADRSASSGFYAAIAPKPARSSMTWFYSPMRSLSVLQPRELRCRAGPSRACRERSRLHGGSGCGEMGCLQNGNRSSKRSTRPPAQQGSRIEPSRPELLRRGHPTRKWAARSYIWTATGLAYLAVMLVGWAARALAWTSGPCRRALGYRPAPTWRRCDPP